MDAIIREHKKEWEEKKQQEKTKKNTIEKKRKPKKKIKKMKKNIYNIIYMSKIFNVYLNSTQKISGNNNDAIYFIDWSSVLPSIYSGLMPILGYCHEPPRSTVVVREPWRSTSKVDHSGRPPRFNFPTCSLFDFRRISLFQKLVLLVVS